LEWLAQAAGHADRNLPLQNYCTGLLLDGERKSVERVWLSSWTSTSSCANSHP
jgi:SRSO17 transposase